MAWVLRSKNLPTYTSTSGNLGAQSPQTAPIGTAQLTWAPHLNKYFIVAAGQAYASGDLAVWDFAFYTYLDALAYLPSESLLVYGSGTTLGTSPDGEVETARATTAAAITRLTYLPATGQMFCLTASSTIYYTSDGITWASADCGITPNAICYANGLYIVGGAAGALQTSPDLTTWTARTPPSTSYAVRDFAVNATGTIIAAADVVTFRSTDGVTWVNGGASGAFVGYSAAEDLFLTVRANDARFHIVYTSPDGATWTYRDPWIGGQGSPTGVAYLPALGALAITSNAGIATTVDGTAYKNPALVNGLLVFTIGFRGNAAFTVPSGWTLAQQQSGGNTSTTTSSSIGSGLVAFYTTADGTLPTYTNAQFARTGGDIAIGALTAYANGALAALDASVSATLAANSTAVTCAGVTTTEEGCLLVGVAALADNTTASNMRATSENTSYINITSYNDPSSVWQRRVALNTALGSDTGLYVWDCVKPSAGATGTVQYTAGNSSKHVILVAAFKAVAASSGVTADGPLSSVTLNPTAAEATPLTSGAASLPNTTLTAPAAAVTTTTAVLASGAFDNIALSSPAGSAAPAGAWVGSLQDVWLLPPSGAHAASAAAVAAVAGVSLSAVQATLDTRTSGAAGCSSVTLVAPSGAGGVLNIGEAAGALAPMMLSPTAGGGQGMGGGQGSLTTTSLLTPRASATARTEAAGTISSVMVRPPTGAGGTQAEAFGSGELRQIGVTRPGALSIPAGYAQGAFQTADLTPPNAAQAVLVRGAGGAAAVAITPPETNATAVSETRAAAPLPGLSATPAQGTAVADVAAGAAVVPLSVTPVTASAVAQAIAVGEGGFAPSSITAPAASAAQELTAYAAIEPLLLAAAASDGDFVAVADAPLPAWTLLAPNGAPGVDMAGQGAMGGVTIAAPMARGGDSLLVGHASAAVRVRKHESVAMVRIQVGGDGYAGSDERVRTVQRGAVTRNMPSWRYR